MISTKGMFMYKILDNKDNKTALILLKDIRKVETTLILSKQEWQRFIKEVVRPSKPTKALRELIKLDSF